MVQATELAEIAPLYLDEPQAALLNGMVLGLSIKHTGEFYKQTIDSGLVHLVVVSGSNIALLSGALIWATQWLPKHLSLVVASIAIVFFVFFVGLQPPVVRAGIMATIATGGLLAGRQQNILYNLAVSAVIIAIIWPEWLSSLSFYLTYLATTGIVLFAKPQVDNGKKLHPVAKLSSYIVSELRTGIAAQVFIWPVLLIFFGRTSFISVITTAAVSWTIVPIMFLGFLLIVLHLLGLPYTGLPACGLTLLLDYIIYIVNVFS